MHLKGPGLQPELHTAHVWQHTQDVHDDGVVGAEPREDYFMVREALDAGKIVMMNGKDEWFGVKVVQPSFVQE